MKKEEIGREGHKRQLLFTGNVCHGIDCTAVNMQNYTAANFPCGLTGLTHDE